MIKQRDNEIANRQRAIRQTMRQQREETAVRQLIGQQTDNGKALGKCGNRDTVERRQTDNETAKR
jgi:hypothetical protein